MPPSHPDASKSRATREGALKKLEALLAADPRSLDAQFERAILLTGLSRLDDARAAYLQLLAVDPAHEGALNNLGTLLHETGYRSAARTAYQEAVTRHPQRPMGHVNLGNLLLADEVLDAARDYFEIALKLAPGHAEAHRGLAQTLAALRRDDDAWRHYEAAYAGRAISVAAYRGTGKPIRALMLVSAVGGNVVTRFLLDAETFETTAVVAEFADADAPLPAHDFIFNAIGDADLCGRALANAEKLVAKTTRPVVNSPASVKTTGRAALMQRLADMPGVRAPKTIMLTREACENGEALDSLRQAGMQFPVLLRTAGFHTGKHFVAVERDLDFAAAAATLPGRALAAIARLDARGADGMYRKYRVMTVAGQLYPLHLAISANWKVHYFTADMAANADYRAAEKVFLDDMAGTLGPVAIAALGRIAEALALDYAGMDFAVGADGEVLLFEANATMVVNPPEPDATWDYRRPAVDRVLAAVRAMLHARAAIT